MLREQLEQAKQQQKETKAEMRLMEETSARLRKRLDDKDATIRDLRAILEEVRAGRDIQIGDSGVIAEAALRLSNVVEDAQKAT